MIITAGSTDVTVPVYFVDDVSGTNTGEPTAGLLFSNIETGGSASFQRQGAARSDFTLVTVAVAAAHTDGGFILIDDTECPGLYRLDVPDAAFTSGADWVTIYLRAASGSNTIMRPLVIDLLVNDLRAAQVNANVTQWLGTPPVTPNTAGVPVIDQIRIVGGLVPTPTTTGVPDVNVERWLDTLVTLSAGAPDVNIQSTDDIALSTTQKSDVNTEVLDVLDTDTFVELGAVPAATSTLVDKINWIFALARNKITQTSTTLTLRDDADAGDIAASTVSDAAGTATRGEFT